MDQVARVIGWSDGSTVQQRLRRGYVGRRARPAAGRPKRADDAATVKRIVDRLAGGSSEALWELRALGARYVARRLVALRMTEAGNESGVIRYRQRLQEQREYLTELLAALDDLDAAIVEETAPGGYSDPPD